MTKRIFRKRISSVSFEETGDDLPYPRRSSSQTLSLDNSANPSLLSKHTGPSAASDHSLPVASTLLVLLHSPTAFPHLDISSPSTLPEIRASASGKLPTKNMRQPKVGNTYTESKFRPPVPAGQRLLRWTTPYSTEAQRSLDSEIPAPLQIRALENIVQARTAETRQVYGAGLLRFTQFCDEHAISEQARMPASSILLSAFIAEHSGSRNGKTIRLWLDGLRLWHMYNLAEWHGESAWVQSSMKAADRLGVSHSCPARGPITAKHLHALRKALVISQPRDAAIWAAATSAFFGCRRLGELLPRSRNEFSNVRQASRGCRISSSTSNGRRVLGFHLPWTKTTSIRGGECILTATGDELCPVTALENHLKVNSGIPLDASLFAFRTSSGFDTLTKTSFLHSCSSIFVVAGLDPIHGHSFRIGGTCFYLESGTAPEIVMKLGGWSSLCFLLYWRNLQSILPSHITSSWDSSMSEFARRHNLSLASNLPS
jgi:hypothetical protein